MGFTCSNGHVVEGDNVIYEDLRGKTFYRCKTCVRESARKYRERVKPSGNAIRKRADACRNGHIYDEKTRIDKNGRRVCMECKRANRKQHPKDKYCANGHEFTPENTQYTRSNGRRICVTCLERRRKDQYDKLKMRRRNKRLQKVSEPAKISMPERVEVRVDDETLKAYREEASALSKVLQFDARHLLIKPRAREAWDEFRGGKQYGARNCADRESEFVDYAVKPSNQQARLLCENCPALKLCGNFAALEKPMAGIYGGEVYDIDLDD